MNKGIIYKTVVKGKNDVTYYIKLEKPPRMLCNPKVRQTFGGA